VIQSRDLVMIALGNQGEAKRWFGPPLEDGVHLRWAFRPELGFPSGGFGLSRRPHVAGTLIDLAGATGPVIELPELARKVTAEFTNLSWLRFVPPPHPLPGLVGLFEKVPVSTGSDPSVARPRVTVSMENDAIKAVRVDTPGRWRLRRLRYVPVSQDMQDMNVGWTDFPSICLPLTDPNYPCHTGAVNPATDWKEAKSRVGEPNVPPDPIVFAQYLALPEWTELHDRLRGLFDPPIPASLSIPTTLDGEPPALGVSPVDLMLLASIDPYFARILGLYWWDRTTLLDQVYDYKLVGKWLKTQLKTPEVTLDFDGDRSGRRQAQTFFREGLILRSLNRGLVEAVSGTPWNDTRHALDLGPFTDTGTPNRPAYLRIQFEQPVAEAQLYLQVRNGEPRLAASITNVVSSWKSPDGSFMVLTVGATNENERIEFVTLDPATATQDLHVSLCKVGVLRNWSAPIGEERVWITYNVRSGTPASMSAPQGLVVKSLRTPTRELPDEVLASGPRAGLHWSLPLEGEVLLPREPVRYLIERQKLGSGAVASAIDPDPTAWDPANLDAPVAISAAEDGPPHLYFDDPAAATAPVPADRHYAYRVAGIDLFGRLSPYSAPRVADLSDSEAPPPPLNVEAEYLDPPSAGVRVRWEWSPNRRIQAPDAREFRVYAQKGRLNTIVGRVTEVIANADGSFAVTTDQTVPNNVVDTFAGEWFLNDGVYFSVLHNTAGIDFQITVSAPSVPPPARPAIGPFTLPVRPPRSLEGTITNARAHLDGRVTLRTDQTTDVAVNGLTGKWLRQGGGDFLIKGNTTGENFRITVKGRGLPPRVPAKGTFAVIEADRVNPVRVDPGNLLYLDYRESRHWAKRLRVVEPLAEPIVGFIGAVDINHEAGTSLVSTDQTFDDPEDHFDRGMLRNNGYVFPVLAHTVGPKFELRVSNLKEADGSTIVPALGRFVYHMGYKVIIQTDISDPAGEAVAYTQVAVSTADDKDYVPDDPRWNGTLLGNRTGNEGMLSSPVAVQKPLRQELKRPDAPDVGDGLATAADYYGRSFIEVRWQKQEGMRVDVYRALDEAIFTADRKARSTRPTDRDKYQWLSDEDFEALVIQTPDYAALSDENEKLRLLASLPGNEEAFGLITPAPLESDFVKAVLDGRATNRHCFALKLVDAAGNRSRLLGWPSRPVRAPKTLPPRVPVITKVFAGDPDQTIPGDRKITLKWASNREPNLKEYRIYRAETEEAARDQGLMTRIHTEPVSNDSMARPAEMAWTDNSVRGLITYRYSIVAVDHVDNVSTRSELVTAQAYDQTPPEPPGWVSAAWNANGSGIDLSWTSSDPNVQTVVLRRDSGAWRPVSSWLPAGVTSFTDSTTDRAVENRYRLRIRNAAGNMNITYIEIAIAPL